MRCSSVLILVAIAACGDGKKPSQHDSGNSDAAVDATNVVDPDAAIDAPPDAAIDAMPSGNCQTIAPWCADGTCLHLPVAPQRGNRTATAFGANGTLYFAPKENNALARISPSSPLTRVPLPAGTLPGFRFGTVSAMTAVSPTDIYACVPNTIVWHFDGAQWSQLPDWLSGECDVLWAASANDFWSIGLGYLRRKLNGTWTEYGNGRRVYALDGRGPNDVWFGGMQGYLAHWNGTQYEVLIDVSGNGDTPDVRNVAVLGTDDIAFGTNRLINGTVMTSVQLGYPAAPEITWGSSNDFWIVTRPSGAATPRTLWRYNGMWTQHTVSADVNLAGIAINGTGPNDVWFVSDHATLHWNGTTLDSCATWQAAPPTGKIVGIGATYGELWIQDATTSGLWRSANGASFVDVYAEPVGLYGFDAHASGVFGAAGTDLGNPSNGGKPIAQRYNGGTSWTDLACPWTQGEEAILRAAKVVGTNDVWFAGDGGHVFHWDGTTCALVPHPLAVTTFRHINATGPNDVWIFGDAATLHWDGTSLLRHPQTISIVDSDAAGTSLWAIATNDVLEWNGTTWTSKGGGSISLGKRIVATSGTDVWVYTDKLMRFDGTTWTAQPLAFGAGIGTGMWGNGTPGDFVLSLSNGVARHQ